MIPYLIDLDGELAALAEPVDDLGTQSADALSFARFPDLHADLTSPERP